MDRIQFYDAKSQIPPCFSGERSLLRPIWGMEKDPLQDGKFRSGPFEMYGTVRDFFALKAASALGVKGSSIS